MLICNHKDNQIHCPTLLRVACEKIAKDFFKQQLHVDDPVVDSIQFVRCHRLGEKLQLGKRPIIVRSERYSERQLIWILIGKYEW